MGHARWLPPLAAAILSVAAPVAAGFDLTAYQEFLHGHEDLSGAELEAIAQFLKYASEINTAGWPPNKQG